MKKDYYFAVNVSVQAKDSEEAEDLVYGMKTPKNISIDDVNQCFEEDDDDD